MKIAGDRRRRAEVEQLTFLERIENRGRKPSIRLVHAQRPGRISSETSSTTWHETPQHPTRNAIAPDGLNYGCASVHVERGYANAISAAFLTPFHMASP